ncbi:glycosyltransferase [Corallococcus sp. EGB]|uniref:glycosyltransferase n=1 Tax=Corallococcus sp. EGB TaxID=1521117 RepID=UPI001CBB92E8|nr:glycosyltransferase [Corallococcus sp. EGB]
MAARRQHWRLYALGGGLGHLTRAAGLARAAVARGHRVELLTNSPFAPGLPLESFLGSGATVHRLDAHGDKAATVAAVAAWLAQAPPDVLVVDTFPRGLAGELVALLPAVRAPRVLVHRDLNPVYVERFHVARAVDAFDLLVVPGEDAPFAHHPRAVRTAPWLLLDADALLPREEARRRLGLEAEDARPLVAVMGCGRPEEVAEAGATADRLRAAFEGRAAVRWLVPMARDSGQAVWPALELMRGVDVLVGAGGYNTVQETRATGTPLVAWARPRLYDRQALRLTAAERVEDAGTLEAKVASLLQAGPRERPSAWGNGVHAAVEAIERVAR